MAALGSKFIFTVFMCLTLLEITSGSAEKSGLHSYRERAGYRAGKRTERTLDVNSAVLLQSNFSFTTTLLYCANNIYAEIDDPT